MKHLKCSNLLFVLAMIQFITISLHILQLRELTVFTVSHEDYVFIFILCVASIVRALENLGETK